MSASTMDVDDQQQPLGDDGWTADYIAVSAELPPDRANEFRFNGGLYSGNVKPTPYLHDFKLPEFAGGYTYIESNAYRSPLSNRFIYWKTTKDAIDFVELSLDCQLQGNQLRLRFQNTPVLDSVAINETPEEVVILLATVASVHRLSFPHPRRHSQLHASSSGPKVRPSIFTSFNGDQLRDPNHYFMLSNANLLLGGSGSAMNLPVSCSSWLTTARDAVFALTSNHGALTLVTLSSLAGVKVDIFELKQASLSERIKGFLPSIIRGGQENEEAVIQATTFQHGSDTLIFALCQDSKIRVWSYRRRECILVHNVRPDGYKLDISTVRKPQLRKGLYFDNLYLGVYFYTDDQSEFVIYKLVLNETTVALENTATLYSPLQDDLLDFGLLKDELWTMWLSSQLDVNIYYTSFSSPSQGWRRVTLSQDVMPKFNFASMKNASQPEFIDEIFLRSRFSNYAIAKALGTFSRTKDENFSSMKRALLIDEVIKAIELKVRQKNPRIADEQEFAIAEKEHWETFYSYCIQYKTAGDKPLGLILDPKTGLVGLIKKVGISFCVMTDLIGSVVLSLDRSLGHKMLSRQVPPTAHKSLSWLFKAIKIFEANLPDELVQVFDNRVHNAEDPKMVAQDLVEQWLLEFQHPDSLNQKQPLKQFFPLLFGKATQLGDAFRQISEEYLCLDRNRHANEDGTLHPLMENMYASHLGLSIISETLKLMSRAKYNFARNALLLQSVIVLYREKLAMQHKQIEILSSDELPTWSNYVRIYCYLNWLCQAPVEANIVQSERNESLLATLELTEYVNANRQLSSERPTDALQALIAYYIDFKGGSRARSEISSEYGLFEDMILENSWQTLLPEFVNHIFKQLWPSNSSFQIAEFLVGTGQNHLMFEHVRLCNEWVRWNGFSREFLTGYYLLLKNEAPASVVYFKNALPGIRNEPFLQRMIGALPDEELTVPPTEPEISLALESNQVFSYFVKVIRLVKLCGSPAAVVKVASDAITILEELQDSTSKEQLSCLYTNVFLAQLELLNIGEAYQAMILNPDQHQRKDCLRQFVVKLCDSRLISELIGFAYSGVTEDFVNILESRARSSDLTGKMSIASYYEILYAYFIRDGNYRKAASTLYEYGRRLGQEVLGLESLEKQVRCFLHTLNCLRLVPPKTAWILKPSLKGRQSIFDMEVDENSQVKRTADGEAVKSSKRKIDIVGIEEIKIEYEVVSARCRLLKKDSKRNEIVHSSLSAAELVTLLISNNLFDTAFHLCKMTKQPYRAVFEGLVSRYIYMVSQPQADQNDSLEVYEYLQENATPGQTFVGSADSTPLEKLWHLISIYLDRYEIPGRSALHRCVAEKLLEMGIGLPTSLRISYQKRNCPELLWLLMSYNYLEIAASLAINYTEAYLGEKCDEFDIKGSLFLSPAIYFPHNHMQNLLLLLAEGREQSSELSEFYDALKSKLNAFDKLALQESQTVLAAES